LSHEASRLRRVARLFGICRTISLKWNVLLRSGGNLVRRPIRNQYTNAAAGWLHGVIAKEEIWGISGWKVSAFDVQVDA
jgi:hypothetical protein